MDIRSHRLEDKLSQMQYQLAQLEAAHAGSLAQCLDLVRKHLTSLVHQTTEFPSVQHLVLRKGKHLLSSLSVLSHSVKTNSSTDNSESLKKSGVRTGVAGAMFSSRSADRFDTTEGTSRSHNSQIEPSFKLLVSDRSHNSSLTQSLQLTLCGNIQVVPTYDNEKLLQKLRELLTDKEKRIFKLETANTRLLAKAKALLAENASLKQQDARPRLSLTSQPGLLLITRPSPSLLLSRQVLDWISTTEQLFQTAFASLDSKLQALHAKSTRWHSRQTFPRAAQQLVEAKHANALLKSELARRETRQQSCRTNLPCRIPESIGKLWQTVERLVCAQDLPRLAKLVSEVRRSNFPSADNSVVASCKNSFSTVEGLILGLHTPSRHYFLEDSFARDSFVRDGSFGSPPEVSWFDVSVKGSKEVDTRLEVINKQLQTIDDLRGKLQDYEGLRERLKHARFLVEKVAETLSSRNSEGRALLEILQAILKDSH